MLDLEKRLRNIEALTVQQHNQASNLPDEDDLDAVVRDIFDEIRELNKRVDALINAVDIVDTTL